MFFLSCVGMSSHLGLIRNLFNFLNRNVLCTKNVARGEQALAMSVFIESIVDQAQNVWYFIIRCNSDLLLVGI